MGNITKRLVKKSLQMARKSSTFRHLSDRYTFQDLISRRCLYKNREWGQLDSVFTASRRQLFKNPGWRYGPLRVQEVAKEAFEAISAFISVENKTYCDLGCGRYNPLGMSTIFYLNGASSTFATDIASYKTDSKRASEAIYDLLVECLIKPNNWNFSGLKQEDFLARIREFDLEELRNGNLETGIAKTPLKHIVTDIHNP